MMLLVRDISRGILGEEEAAVDPARVEEGTREETNSMEGKWNGQRFARGPFRRLTAMLSYHLIEERKACQETDEGSAFQLPSSATHTSAFRSISGK
jgi:hypothetical protein